MSCRITNNITTACNRNQGGIRKIYLANGPLEGTLESPEGVIYAMFSDIATYTLVSPWYVIELPRVTGTFDEVFEINQANGTVVYNQELRFVTNEHTTDTRQRLIELAQSNDMIVVFEDNNGKLWLMGEQHGCYLSTATTETGVNYGDRRGHTVVIAARNPDPAQEVFSGVVDDPLDPSIPLGNSQTYWLGANAGSEPNNTFYWSEYVDNTGWQTPYDTVAGRRQSSYFFGYLGRGGVAFPNSNVPVVGAVAYYNSPGSPFDRQRYYIDGRGYIWAGSGSISQTSNQGSTFSIVDFDNGVVTAVRSFGNYTCVKPEPLVGQGYDPYYKIYYGYEYLGNTTTWVSDNIFYQFIDAKNIIEAMPVGATPLYYRVLKTRGHVPIFDYQDLPGGQFTNKTSPAWPFPQNDYQLWNYDTNVRNDIPVGKGYVFNNNNQWSFAPSELVYMFNVENSTGNLWCPEIAGAKEVGGTRTLYEEI